MSRMFAGLFNVYDLPGKNDGLTAEVSTGLIRSSGNVVVVGGLIPVSITGAATLEPDFAALVTATKSAAR